MSVKAKATNPRRSKRAPGDPSPHRRVDIDGIFRELRFRIVSLQYEPGEILREVDLANEFGASRTPIRQVLQQLERAELVTPVVGVGTIVTEIDPVRIRQAIEFRVELCAILAHFISLKEPDRALNRLKKLEKRHQAVTGVVSQREFARISHDLRALVAELIDNPYVRRMWIDTYYVAGRLWYQQYDGMSSEFVELQADEIRGLRRAISMIDPKMVAAQLQFYLRAWQRALEPALTSLENRAAAE